MLPDVSRKGVLLALELYDREVRPNHRWKVVKGPLYQNAIEYEGQLYPVTRVIALATGAPFSSFQSNPEENTYLLHRGFTVVTRRGGGGWRVLLFSILVSVGGAAAVGVAYGLTGMAVAWLIAQVVTGAWALCRLRAIIQEA